MVPNITKQV